MQIHSSYKLCTLYDTIGINYYGLFIVLGVIVSFYLLKKNTLFQGLTSHPQFTNVINYTIIAGIIGGRLLTVIAEYPSYNTLADCIAISQGGFSVLGSMIGAIIAAYFFLSRYHIPLLPTFDATAVYAPLLQSIARIGCFIVGCCHGVSTSSIVGVIYTHPETLASCSSAVHPTQLYSAFLLFLIFLYLKSIAPRIYRKPGYLFCAYLALAALERFFVDFWRADRIATGMSVSFHQGIALGLLIFSGSLFSYLQLHRQQS